jgi:hypothetical protein
MQQNRCLPPFLPEDEGRYILQNIASFIVLRFLRIFKIRREMKFKRKTIVI